GTGRHSLAVVRAESADPGRVRISLPALCALDGGVDHRGGGDDHGDAGGPRAGALCCAPTHSRSNRLRMSVAELIAELFNRELIPVPPVDPIHSACSIRGRLDPPQQDGHLPGYRGAGASALGGGACCRRASPPASASAFGVCRRASPLIALIVNGR